MTTNRKPNTGRTFTGNSRLTIEVRCRTPMVRTNIEQWCEENAKGLWAVHISAIERNIYLVVGFELKDDAALFKMFFG